MKTIKTHLLCLMASIALGTTSLIHSAEASLSRNKKSPAEMLASVPAKDRAASIFSEMTPKLLAECYFDSVKKDEYQFVEMLLEKELDPDLLNAKGLTGLMLAASYGDTRTLHVLLQAKPNLNLVFNHPSLRRSLTALDMAEEILRTYDQAKREYPATEKQPFVSKKTLVEKIEILKKHGAKTKAQLDTIRLEIKEKVAKAKQLQKEQQEAKECIIFPINKEGVTTLVTLLEEIWGKKPN